MSVREIWNMILRSYSLIVTGSLFCTGVFCELFWQGAPLGVDIIWQVLLASAGASLLFFLYYSKKELGAKALLLRTVLHFISLLGFLMLCGYLFKWFLLDNLVQPFSFAGLVCVTYAVIRFLTYQMDKKDAAAISNALKDYNEEKTE